MKIKELVNFIQYSSCKVDIILTDNIFMPEILQYFILQGFEEKYLESYLFGLWTQNQGVSLFNRNFHNRIAELQEGPKDWTEHIPVWIPFPVEDVNAFDIVEVIRWNASQIGKNFSQLFVQNAHLIFDDNNPRRTEALIDFYKTNRVIGATESTGNKIHLIWNPHYPVPNTLKSVLPILEIDKDEDWEEVIEKLFIWVNDEELRQLKGLSLSKRIYAMDMLFTCDNFDIHSIKKELFKESIVEFVQRVSFEEVGGLENLKEWIKLRSGLFGNPEAKEFGIQTPKGVLLLGIPGTGKSLSAKAIAHQLDLPLVKLDIGKIFRGFVGESEATLRQTLKEIEAMSPVVLWIDEIEKGVAGMNPSASTDSGTAARVLGTLLNWMQEKTAEVFIVATANNMEALPPELIRKGRFDEVFFVDLPNKYERWSIFEVHIRKSAKIEYAEISELFDETEIVQATENFTGAEIENAVNEMLIKAFAEQAPRSHWHKIFIETAKEIIPLALTMSEEIQRMREWARNKTRNASGTSFLWNTSGNNFIAN